MGGKPRPRGFCVDVQTEITCAWCGVDSVVGRGYANKPGEYCSRKCWELASYNRRIGVAGPATHIAWCRWCGVLMECANLTKNSKTRSCADCGRRKTVAGTARFNCNYCMSTIVAASIQGRHVGGLAFCGKACSGLYYRMVARGDDGPSCPVCACPLCGVLLPRPVSGPTFCSDEHRVERNRRSDARARQRRDGMMGLEVELMVRAWLLIRVARGDVLAGMFWRTEAAGYGPGKFRSPSIAQTVR